MSDDAATDNKPVTQRDQQMRQAALMIADGKMTDKEIAAKLEIATSTLGVWKKSPLFKEMVSTFSQRIIDGGVQTIIDSIMADGPTNLSFLKEVRDGRFSDDPKRMAVRLKAGEMLFDRQAPKNEKGVSDNAVKIVIGGRLLGQMVRAMKNDGAEIEAEFEEITDQTNGPKTVDQLVEQQRAEALAAAQMDDEDEDE